MSGTQAASAPAIRKPRTISVHTEAQSITKKWLVAVNPLPLKSLDQIEPPSTLMSIAACPSIRPASPRSACRLAISTSFGVSVRRKIRPIRMTMMMPPANSAAMKGQPRSTTRMMPSSMTRLVEASLKGHRRRESWRPCGRSSGRGRPRRRSRNWRRCRRGVAKVRLRGESSPRKRAIALCETTAWTTPESAEAEDQRPEDLPEHVECGFQGVAEGAEKSCHCIYLRREIPPPGIVVASYTHTGYMSSPRVIGRKRREKPSMAARQASCCVRNG